MAPVAPAGIGAVLADKKPWRREEDGRLLRAWAFDGTAYELRAHFGDDASMVMVRWARGADRTWCADVVTPVLTREAVEELRRALEVGSR